MTFEFPVFGGLRFLGNGPLPELFDAAFASRFNTFVTVLSETTILDFKSSFLIMKREYFWAPKAKIRPSTCADIRRGIIAQFANWTRGKTKASVPLSFSPQPVWGIVRGRATVSLQSPANLRDSTCTLPFGNNGIPVHGSSFKVLVHARPVVICGPALFLYRASEKVPRFAANCGGRSALDWEELDT